MTVDDWVRESLEDAGPRGKNLREIQRWIDEHRGEELAVDTIETSLGKLINAERAQLVSEGRYAILHKTGAADALRKLFGE